MKTLFFALALIFFSLNVFSYTNPEVIIKQLFSKEKMENDPLTFCEKKWTRRGDLDKEMFQYCVREHGKAMSELGHNIQKWGDENWLAEAIIFCGEKWTKRSVTDYSMLNYCVKQQHEGVLDIEYYLENNSNLQPVYQRCKRKWTVDRTMIAYCIKEAIDG